MMTMHGRALCVAAEHPALAGHFPGRPIVPGVVLLDLVLREIEAALGQPLPRCELPVVKFLRAVSPATPLWLDASTVRGRLNFVLRDASGAVASGSLSWGQPA